MWPLRAVIPAVMSPIDSILIDHVSRQEDISWVEIIGFWVFKADADTCSFQFQELGFCSSRLWNLVIYVSKYIGDILVSYLFF